MTPVYAAFDQNDQRKTQTNDVMDEHVSPHVMRSASAHAD